MASVLLSAGNLSNSMFTLQPVSIHFCSRGGGGGGVKSEVTVNSKEENS
jgi:hypothetical protein